MAGIQRVTRQLAKILSVLLDARLSGADPEERKLHGYRLMELTGLSGPSVYRNLDRLEDMDLVTAWWEPVTDDQARPRRRYYVLNENGIAAAHEAAHRYPQAGEEVRRMQLAPRTNPGLGTQTIGPAGFAERLP
jgi:DNA-binding PadR family transcriptional regulator